MYEKNVVYQFASHFEYMRQGRGRVRVAQICLTTKIVRTTNTRR
jgi:hypothetical protein